jgi:hypothetical protein
MIFRVSRNNRWPGERFSGITVLGVVKREICGFLDWPPPNPSLVTVEPRECLRQKFHLKLSHAKLGKIRLFDFEFKSF